MVQPLDKNWNMDTPSAETLCDGKANRGKKKTRKSKKAIVKDECQSLDQNNTDAQLVSNCTEGNVIVDKLIKDEVKCTVAEGTVAGKRTKKRKRTARKETEPEVQRELDASSLAEKNMTTKTSKIKDAVQKTGSTNMDIGNPKIQDETQSMCHTNLDDGQSQSVITKRKPKKTANVTNEKPKVKDELPSLGQTQMNTGSTENLVDGKVITENPKDEAHSMNQNSMDTMQPAENLAQEDVAGKRIKEGKNKKKAKGNNEIHSETETDTTPENLAEGVADLNKPETKDAVAQTEMDIGSTYNDSERNVTLQNPKVQDKIHCTDQEKMDTGPTENLAEGNMIMKRKKKQTKTKKAKVRDEFLGRMEAGSTEVLADVDVNNRIADTRDEVPCVGLTQMDTGSTGNVAEENVTIENPKDQDEFQSIDQANMDTGPTQNLAPGNVTVKRKRRRKRSKKAKVDDEFSSRTDAGQAEMLPEVNINNRIPETRSEVPSGGLTQVDTGSADNVAEGNVTIENPKDHDEIQSIYQAKVDAGPTQNLAEGNVTVKRKKRRKRTKAAKVEDEFSGRIDAGVTENIAAVNINIPEVRDKVPRVGSTQTDTRLTHNVAEGNVTAGNSTVQDEIQSIDQAKVDTVTLSATVKRRRRQRKKANLMDKLSGRKDAGSTKDLDEGIGHAEGRSAIPTHNAVTVKDVEILCLKTAPIVSVGRKLLVLDINGLLADVVFPAPKHYKADTKLFGRAVFRRPFCDDFLKFCFQNFNVGIWSSRTKKVIDRVLSLILDDQKDNLLFVWDMKHCTKTGFKTVENHHKPLVCKELRKIWENDDPGCPWKKGDFNESNTLLIDDSPYKALLNPLHTAISPHPYQYTDDNDNSLGPGGDLRVYLEGLAASENVQKYVEQHPFGQSPICEQDMSWEFYNRVLNQMSNVTTSQPMVS